MYVVSDTQHYKNSDIVLLKASLCSFQADDAEHYLNVPIDDCESAEFKMYLEKIINFIGKLQLNDTSTL